MNAIRSKTVKIGKRKFRISSDDDYLNHIGSHFEPSMVRVFESLIRKEDTVLDIGANIGCTTLLFSELAQEVYAFEPSPSTFDLLRTNIEDAEIKNVHLYNIGLGDQQGNFELTYAPQNRAGGFVSNQTKASTGHIVEEIKIETLDDFAKSHLIEKIDFLKIDVEGFEKSVISGGRAALLKNQPTVVLELNHWCLNAFQRISVPDFFDFLRAKFPYLYAVHDKSVMNLHDESSRYIVMYNHINHMKYCNLVGAYSEQKLRQLRS